MDEDNILIMPNVKRIFIELKMFFVRTLIFSTVGIKIPSGDELNQDMKYVQINADDIMFNRDNVVVNVVYHDVEELKQKIISSCKYIQKVSNLR